MILRSYQTILTHRARLAIRPIAKGGEGYRSACVVLPTGGGATRKNKTVWILVHRQELLEQTCEKLRVFGVPHGIISPGQPEINVNVQVAMIQTLRRRLDRWAPPDLIITDECHHAPSKTYTEILEWLPKTTKSLGFTATPERLDGRPLGEHYETLIEGPSIRELIDHPEQYLVPPVVYAPPVDFDPRTLHTKYGDYIKSEMAAGLDRAQITGDVIAHYRKYADGLAAVVFCVSVEHAAHVASEFNNAGISAISVDGKLKKEERKARLNAFRDGSAT
jgi:superfamily II DNA or RNA helicase